MPDNKNKEQNYIRQKLWFSSSIISVIAAGILTPFSIHAESCRTPASMCDVNQAINDAKLAPPPAAAAPAEISLSVTSVSSIIPSPGTAPKSYRYTITNTISGSAANTSAPLAVTCTPAPLYYIYTGGSSASGSAAALATFTTTTPGTTCPLGTLNCGTPANIVLTLPASGAVTTAIDTNYNTQFTSSNTGWMAYVTGSYNCSYTDPNLGYAVTRIIPWGQSS